MVVLRWAFLVASLVTLTFIASRAPWLGTMQWEQTTYQIDRGRAPIWAPPPLPTAKDFARDFAGTPGFEAAQRASKAYGRELRISYVLTEAALLFWPLTMAAGLMYLVVRRGRQDVVLHAAWWTGVGLTLVAILTIGAWALMGGWGPPVLLFLLPGLIIGWSVGAVVFLVQRHEAARERFGEAKGPR